ncbi:DUF4143 domain-containing protein [Blastococcus sp. KM273129]|uniref:DUF4143 domain-containing protein n=1 Tax=Blastococcus sp. KM273129 TaxID=2570315 RepID=UPI001F166209|nr:DUF4143 domain-containing protein [Blastococcus sp. KM273129]
MRADPSRLTAGPPPTLVDEWQRYPTSWDVMRRAMDADNSPERFLLSADRLLARRSLDGRDPSQPLPRDGTYLGALFELLVALHARVFAQAAEASVAHLGTKGGEREIDFIVTGPTGRVLALEGKLTHAVSDSDVRHLRWLTEQLGPDLVDAAVITTGPDAYRRADGIAVVPLALLGP